MSDDHRTFLNRENNYFPMFDGFVFGLCGVSREVEGIHIVSIEQVTIFFR